MRRPHLRLVDELSEALGAGRSTDARADGSIRTPLERIAMGSGLMLEALRAVGDRLATASPSMDAPVDLLVIGGAAGMLSGMLDSERTTADCDVMCYEPASAQEAVERIAAEIAAEFGLGERWLNGGGAPWSSALPDGWRERRRLVLEHGRLRVFAVSRLDLIVLKLVAGRPQDIEDLESLRLDASEIVAIRAHLAAWPDPSWPRGVVDEALALLAALETPAPPTPHA